MMRGPRGPRQPVGLRRKAGNPSRRSPSARPIILRSDRNCAMRLVIFAAFAAIPFLCAPVQAKDGHGIVVSSRSPLSLWSNTVTKSINDHLAVPAVPWERTMDGVVSVTFHCDGDGRPVGMRVVKESGEVRLDRAAMRVGQLRQQHRHALEFLGSFQRAIHRWITIHDVRPFDLGHRREINYSGTPYPVGRDGLRGLEEIGPGIGDMVDRSERGKTAIGVLDHVLDVHHMLPAPYQPSANGGFMRQDGPGDPLGNSVMLIIHATEPFVPLRQGCSRNRRTCGAVSPS